ncbi:O-Glycosyl hydrolase family 30 [compost metagenome]
MHLGSWDTGERYGRNMIGDFNNWMEGYLDWNLVLDETGGPNHVNNLCDAPVIADTETGEIHYNSSFYYIGHFSKFVRPGAIRIGHTLQREELLSVAFRNEDGSIALIVMNETDEDCQFTLGHNSQIAVTKLPAHSIATYIL